MKSLLTSVFFAAAACSPAMAQENCGAADAAEQFLTERFGEEIAAYGLTEQGSVVEFWVNNETGTWSLVLRQGDTRCLIDSGSDGQSVVIGEVF